MIRIHADPGRVVALDVKGHAGYAEPGFDIVCGSCTITAYVLAHAAKDLEEAGLLERPPKVQMDYGNIRIRFQPKNDARELADAAVLPVLQTFQLIADTYPDHVKMEIAGE